MLGRRSCLCCLAAAPLAAATLAPTPARAQALPFCRYSLRDGWSASGPSEYITREARPDDPSGIPQIVARIRQVFSIAVPFDIYIAEKEDNAFAAVANGKKILVVDVGFLEKINGTARTQWGAIQVVAHEVGHHIAGFSQDRHRGELNADYWSGQALQRLGSAMEAATAAIRAFGTDFDTSSHPNKTRRAQTIERGWTDARRNYIDYSFCDACR